jgi:DNA-binding PadR family transcriptional regulator
VYRTVVEGTEQIKSLTRKHKRIEIYLRLLDLKLSVLDIFVLSMLDRECESAYDLQRRIGMSLGASTPSFSRLLKAKLVSRQEGIGRTGRPRYTYRLTASGKEKARTGWKPFLTKKGVEETDLESILRIVDMAVCYGGERERRNTGSFLRRAAEARQVMADQAEAASKKVPSSRLTYSRMRTQCAASRLRVESEALKRLATLFYRSGDPVEGQQFLPV